MTPTSTEIRAARLAVGLTQAEAGELIHGTRRTWQDWERGERAMPAASWELFLLKTGQHESAEIYIKAFNEKAR